MGRAGRWVDMGDEYRGGARHQQSNKGLLYGHLAAADHQRSSPWQHVRLDSPGLHHGVRHHPTDQFCPRQGVVVGPLTRWKLLGMVAGGPAMAPGWGIFAVGTISAATVAAALN